MKGWAGKLNGAPAFYWEGLKWEGFKKHLPGRVVPEHFLWRGWMYTLARSYPQRPLFMQVQIPSSR